MRRELEGGKERLDTFHRLPRQLLTVLESDLEREFANKRTMLTTGARRRTPGAGA